MAFAWQVSVNTIPTCTVSVPWVAGDGEHGMARIVSQSYCQRFFHFQVEAGGCAVPAKCTYLGNPPIRLKTLTVNLDQP